MDLLWLHECMLFSRNYFPRKNRSSLKSNGRGKMTKQLKYEHFGKFVSFNHLVQSLAIFSFCT